MDYGAYTNQKASMSLILFLYVRLAVHEPEWTITRAEVCGYDVFSGCDLRIQVQFSISDSSKIASTNPVKVKRVTPLHTTETLSNDRDDFELQSFLRNVNNSSILRCALHPKNYFPLRLLPLAIHPLSLEMIQSLQKIILALLDNLTANMSSSSHCNTAVLHSCQLKSLGGSWLQVALSTSLINARAFDEEKTLRNISPIFTDKNSTESVNQIYCPVELARFFYKKYQAFSCFSNINNDEISSAHIDPVTNLVINAGRNPARITPSPANSTYTANPCLISQVSQSLRLLTQAVRAAPDHAHLSLLAESKLLLSLGQGQLALSCARQASTLAPRDHRCWLMLSKTSVANLSFEGALLALNALCGAIQDCVTEGGKGSFAMIEELLGGAGIDVSLVEELESTLHALRRHTFQNQQTQYSVSSSSFAQGGDATNKHTNVNDEPNFATPADDLCSVTASSSAKAGHQPSDAQDGTTAQDSRLRPSSSSLVVTAARVKSTMYGSGGSSSTHNNNKGNINSNDNFGFFKRLTAGLSLSSNNNNNNNGMSNNTAGAASNGVVLSFPPRASTAPPLSASPTLLLPIVSVPSPYGHPLYVGRGETARPLPSPDRWARWDYLSGLLWGDMRVTSKWLCVPAPCTLQSVAVNTSNSINAVSNTNNSNITLNRAIPGVIPSLSISGIHSEVNKNKNFTDQAPQFSCIDKDSLNSKASKNGDLLNSLSRIFKDNSLRLHLHANNNTLSNRNVIHMTTRGAGCIDETATNEVLKDLPFTQYIKSTSQIHASTHYLFNTIASVVMESAASITGSSIQRSVPISTRPPIDFFIPPPPAVAPFINNDNSAPHSPIISYKDLSPIEMKIFKVFGNVRRLGGPQALEEAWHSIFTSAAAGQTNAHQVIPHALLVRVFRSFMQCSQQWDAWREASFETLDSLASRPISSSNPTASWNDLSIRMCLQSAISMWSERCQLSALFGYEKIAVQCAAKVNALGVCGGATRLLLTHCLELMDIPKFIKVATQALDNLNLIMGSSDASILGPKLPEWIGIPFKELCARVPGNVKGVARIFLSPMDGLGSDRHPLLARTLHGWLVEEDFLV